MAASPSQVALAALQNEAPQAVAPARDQRPTPLFIVASPRQSCGKTFIARLLTDYLWADRGKVAAFDLNPNGESLADSRPAMATRANLAMTDSQVALFDRLVVNDGIGKVVDVGHASFDQFFALFDQIEFMSEALRRALEVTIVFPAEPHAAALKAYDGLRSRYVRATVVAVLNDAILKGRKAHFPFSRAAALPLRIPSLPPSLMNYPLRPDCSFADFQSTLPVRVPIGDALELRSWTKRVFLEFRELELRLLLEKLQASLRLRD